MSHATLTVKVTPKRLAAHEGSLDAAIAEMMAPYEEQTKDPRFRVFEDEEAKMREQYATESVEMIRTPDGDLVYRWDQRFKVRGASIFDEKTVIPADCERVNVPHRERYPTFEAFAEGWHSTKPDKVTCKYGHWRNPKAKWDWYQVGGRWRGFFPVKSGVALFVGKAGAGNNEATPEHSDVVRASDLDMPKIEAKTIERAAKFWDEWQSWLAGTFVEKDPFSGPRSMALRIGLLTVAQGPALSDHTQKAIPWAGKLPPEDSRSGWHDVARLIERDAFFADYLDCFCVVRTFAALDNDGWHEAGEMGWFGCSSGTPDTFRQFAREFMPRFVKNAAPDDLLVLVDYHI